MSQLAVDGLRAERDAILTIAKSLTDEEWAGPSACAGWAVRDVIAHMGSVMHGVVDPKYMVDTTSVMEQAMEGPVAERRGWKVDAVLEEYETFSEQATNFFAMAQDPPMAETMLPMGELGTHPMSMLASTFLFDAYCHLRHDILRPHGSVGRAEPPRDEMRLGPTVEWMLAGLPWMCASALSFMDRKAALVLTGPGGGSWGIAPGGDEGRVVVSEDTDGAAATLTSTTHEFVAWGTKRKPWNTVATVVGDEKYAARVFDAVNII